MRDASAEEWGKSPLDRACGVEPRAFRRGELVGGTYRLLEQIGSGGMGEVYAAEHIRLGRQFAVKLLSESSNSQSLERFRRETKAIARIESEFVVNVVDCGEADDGTPYMAMDLLRGEDLRQLLARSSPMPVPRAVDLVWQACQGIAAVHQAGLVHRDLKPGNLFVARRSSGEDWCKILDFGVAKMEASISTRAGAVIGTVKYMAPEQLQDGASAGPRVDIYALGAILYECLSGLSPHSGTTVQELMFKIMNERPARVDERRAEIPLALASAVQRALSKSQSARFATVQEFARAIAPYKGKGASDDAVVSSETVEFERTDTNLSAPVKRRVAKFLAAAVPLLAALGVGVIGGRHFARTNAPVSPSLSTPSRALQSTPRLVSEVSSPPSATSPALTARADLVAQSPSAIASLPSAKRKPPARVSPARPNAKFDASNPYQ